MRERRDDIASLAYHFLSSLNERNQGRRSVKEINGDALAALEAYSWPGNVRELGNAIESAFSFGAAPVITLDDLPTRVVTAWRTTSNQLSSRVVRPVSGFENGGTYLEFERESIARALEQTRGNKLRAARILKISRKKLYNRISRYGLDTVACRSCGRRNESAAKGEK